MFRSICVIILVHKALGMRHIDLIKRQFDFDERLLRIFGLRSSLPMVPSEPWYKKEVITNPYDASFYLQWDDGVDYMVASKNDHQIKSVELPWSVPFYGRMVNTFNINTAGSIIMDHESSFASPSYIAPLMTLCGIDTTKVLWKIIKDTKLIVRWEQHFSSNPEEPFLVEFHLHRDGSMTFLYKNVNKEMVEKCDSEGYSFVIGLFDSFVTPRKLLYDFDVGFYPKISIDVKKITGEPKAILISIINSIEGQCVWLKDEGMCAQNKRCTWCFKQCLFKMEKYRKLSQCSISHEPSLHSRDASPCEKKCHLEPRNFVCGSDGTIYINECFLEREACLFNPNLRVITNDTCSTDCQANCPNENQPFCGSDKVTYDNLCKLNLHKCKNKDLEEITPGSCDHVQEEEFYTYDESISDPSDFEDEYSLDLDLAEKMGCNTTCPKDFQPICLNGNKKFGNKCLMELAICAQNITQIHWKMGLCPSKNLEDLCSTKGCTRELNPVCGSNGKTYSNPCILEQLSCIHSLNLTIEKLGPCGNSPGSNSDCLLSACTKENNPVCGTDGKTYGNRCLLDAAIECVPNLSFQRLGPCKADFVTFKPSPNIQQPIPKDMEPHQPEETSKLKRLFRSLLLLGGMFIMSVLAVVLVRRYQRQQQRYPVGNQITDGVFDPSTLPFPDREQNSIPPRVIRASAAGVELNTMNMS